MVRIHFPPAASPAPLSCRPLRGSNGRPKPSDTAKLAPLFVQRALGPRSRIAIAVWYGGCRVSAGHLRLARPFNWEGRNEAEDSGAFLALWRGPCNRRVGHRSEPRSNGRGPKCLPARPDLRPLAGRVRGDAAARGQMPGGPGVRCSDQPLRDVAVSRQMPGGPGVRRSDEPLRDVVDTLI